MPGEEAKNLHAGIEPRAGEFEATRGKAQQQRRAQLREHEEVLDMLSHSDVTGRYGMKTSVGEVQAAVLPEDAETHYDLREELLPSAVVEAIDYSANKGLWFLVEQDGDRYKVKRVAGDSSKEITHLVFKNEKPFVVVKSISQHHDMWKRFVEPAALFALHLPSVQENEDARFITPVTFLEYDTVPLGGNEIKGRVGFEFANGGSLKQALAQRAGLLEKNGAPLESIAPIMNHVGRALRLMHQARVQHRDIKEDNIVFHRDEDGSVVIKVTDFGISSTQEFFDANKYEVASAGTPFYMDYQAWSGNPNEASDIHALGVTLAFVLFGAKTMQEDVRKRLSAHFGTDIDLNLRNIIYATQHHYMAAAVREKIAALPPMDSTSKELCNVLVAMLSPDLTHPETGEPISLEYAVTISGRVAQRAGGDAKLLAPLLSKEPVVAGDDTLYARYASRAGEQGIDVTPQLSAQERADLERRMAQQLGEEDGDLPATGAPPAATPARKERQTKELPAA